MYLHHFPEGTENEYKKIIKIYNVLLYIIVIEKDKIFNNINLVPKLFFKQT